MKKIMSICLAVVLTMASFGMCVLADEPETEQIPRLEKFYPTDDTQIDGNAKDTNYGTADTILVSGNLSGGGQRYAYFKFDLTQMQNNISKATLTLTVPKTYWGLMDLGVFVSDNTDWDETTLTYNTAQAEDLNLLSNADNAVGTFSQIGTGVRRRTADITQAIQDAKGAGKEQITFIVRVINSTNVGYGVYFYTKEATTSDLRYDDKPTLVVTNADATAPALASNVPVAPSEDAVIDASERDMDGALTGVEKAGISGTLSAKGYKRYYLMKFDLRGAEGRSIKKATLSLTSTDDAAASAMFGIYATDNTDWDANGLTFNNMGTLSEFLDNTDNRLISVESWPGSTTKVFDLSTYVKEKLAAGQYEFTLALRNIDEGTANPYTSFWTAWAAEEAKRPGITMLFANEEVEVSENVPLYPSEDAGVTAEAPDNPRPEETTAAVGGENYFFTKLDLRQLKEEAGNIQMALTGTADSDGAYGVYILPGADWNEYSITYNNAPMYIFQEEAAAMVRYPRAGVERKLDLTDALLPLLQQGERVFSVAVKRLDEGSDAFGVYTKESDVGSPYFLISYKKQPQQGGETIDLSHVEPVDAIPLDAAKANDCLKDDTTFAITGTLSNSGYKRYYVMKFDLSSVQGRVKKATLRVSAVSSLKTSYYGVYLSGSNNWTSEGATFNSFDNSFLQLRDNMIASFTELVTGASTSVDVTEGINQGITNSDGIVTLGIRNVNDAQTGGDNNPWAEFHSAKAASEEKRPYLILELYDETQPVAAGGVTLRSGDTALSALQPGVVTVRANVGCTQVNDNGADVHVIFALCRGTEDAYRVVDLQEQKKHLYDTAGSDLEADFRVEEGDFIKVFIWNREGTRMVGQPSITIH